VKSRVAAKLINSNVYCVSRDFAERGALAGDAGGTKSDPRAASVGTRALALALARRRALCNGGLLVGRIVAPFAQSSAYSQLRSRHVPAEPARA